MNIKRALGFSALLYFSSFLMYGILHLLFGLDAESLDMPLGVYIITWIINIPLVMLLATWYFKRVDPTAKRGLRLGLIAIGFSLCIDALFVVLALMANQSLDQFVAMYSDWRFYITIVEIIAICTYMGWELDGSLLQKPQEK